MTTANKITIFRILLVPFLIVEVLSYVDDGDEWHRFLAITRRPARLSIGGWIPPQTREIRASSSAS
jgi:hypothetical protein